MIDHGQDKSTSRGALDDVLKRLPSLKVKLANYPLYALPSLPFPDSVQVIRQELELQLDAPDRDLRELSCKALRTLFPDPDPRCR